MKNVRYSLSSFAMYDRGGIIAKLEKMAARGWMLSDMGSIFWKYQRIQPTSLKFAVTYCADASQFDPGPTQAQQMLADFGSRDGWQFVCSWGQMQVFCNDRENPRPMETDPITQVENIHRAMKKGVLKGNLVAMVLCLWMFFLLWQQFQHDPLKFLSSPLLLAQVPAWLLLIVSRVWELSSYYIWHHHAVQDAQNGNFRELKTAHSVPWILAVLSFLNLLAAFLSTHSGWKIQAFAIGVILVVMVSGNVCKAVLKKRGVSRGVNRTVSVLVVTVVDVVLLVGISFMMLQHGFLKDRKPAEIYKEGDWERSVYQDSIPLRVEDLYGTYDLRWSSQAEGSSTFLLECTEYLQWPLTEDRTVPSISYRVIDVKRPVLYEFTRNTLLNSDRQRIWPDSGMMQVQADPWKARQAWQLQRDGEAQERYLLCYDNRFVQISFDEPVTQEQKMTVGRLLGQG